MSAALVAVALALASGALAQNTTTFAVQSTAPSSAQPLEAAPVSFSFEFFAFPAYFTNLPNTQSCMAQFRSVTGAPLNVRIGGTTGDRADYDPSLNTYVKYSVSSPTAAPSILTYGPSYFDLAATLEGPTVFGLNRGHNNLSNTIAASKVAISKMSNLYALELGNEPDQYPGLRQPIATTSAGWSPKLDAQSEASWAAAVTSANGGKAPLIQGGNFVSGPPSWGSAELVQNMNASALKYFKTWSHHNYRQGQGNNNLATLGLHSDISSNLNSYLADIQVAAQTGIPYVIGETNSVAGGGAATLSPTFAGAMWVLDFALRATTIGIKRMYYHFGTIGNCAYCWWGNGQVYSPLYGAYAATNAFAGASKIVALDNGSTAFGGYALYNSAGKLIRTVLINSVLYQTSTSSTRPTQKFTLTGLSTCSSAKLRRLAASSSTARVDQGDSVTFAGQTFGNSDCGLNGQQTTEQVSLSSGLATVTLAAAEAVLIDFTC